MRCYKFNFLLYTLKQLFYFHYTKLFDLNISTLYLVHYYYAEMQGPEIKEDLISKKKIISQLIKLIYKSN